MRAAVFALLFAASLPSAALSADGWRIARMWNPQFAKSLAVSADVSAKSTVAIVPPGRLSLSLGCNDMSTKGLKQDGSARLEDPVMTRMACAPNLAALETALLAALRLVRSHERTGNEMIFRDGSGKEVLALIR